MVTKEFLYNEWQKALKGDTTPSCREKCGNCGIMNTLGVCPAYQK
jgi:hypothetical protein